MSGPGARARTEAGAPRGLFVSLEGIEGSGKTTHGKRLTTHLQALGHRVFLTREPGGTPLAEELRRLLLGTEGECPEVETELLMILAGRAQHVRREIAPRLARGEVVVCDRYADASLAYQGGGRGLGVERVAAGNALATGGLVPDLTLLFDLPVDQAMARVARRGREGGAFNRFDRERREFYHAVRETYLRLAEAEPRRFVVLDATLPKPELAERVREVVAPHLADAERFHGEAG